MPELPEVETIVRSIRPLLVGRQITGVVMHGLLSNGTKFPIRPRILSNPPREFVEGVRGACIERVQRYGKNIVFQLRRAEKNRLCSLIVHLGMTGQLTCENTPAFQSRHTHLVFRLDAPATWLHYTDIRQFGRLFLTSHSEQELASLGPDPLEIPFEEFSARLGARRAMLKSLLLNQRFLRGLGNIYADESLFRAGVHPARLASQLSRKRALRLFQAIRETLELAIKKGGSSVSNYVDGRGRAGSFQNLHQVYRRTGQPCFQCGGRIRKILIASRSSHFCPRCQR